LQANVALALIVIEGNAEDRLEEPRYDGLQPPAFAPATAVL
jgi:hypothetical protein